MKGISGVWIAAAILCLQPAAHADDEDRLVDFGKQKMVVIAGTTSSDGRYAVGWTIEPMKEGVKPIDWKLWNPEDPENKGTFLDHYHLREVDAPEDYEVEYYALDLHGKKTEPIAENFQSVRGGVGAAWSNAGAGERHGVLNFSHHFGTNILLVDIDAKGSIHIVDPGEAMDSAVMAVCPAQNGPGTWVAEYSTSGVRFHGEGVDVPFTAEFVKSPDGGAVDGVVTLQLADGKVMHVSTGKSDNTDGAIQADPALKKTDAELNTVYKQLAAKLSRAKSAALKKEQLEWIKTRDDAANRAENDEKRANGLIEATRKRTQELQTRLNAALYNNPKPNTDRSSTGAFLIFEEQIRTDTETGGSFSVALKENPKRKFLIYSYGRYADLYFSPKDSWVVVDHHDGSGSNRCVVLKRIAKPPYFTAVKPETVDNACWDLFWAQHPHPKGTVTYTHQRTYFCQWLDDTRFIVGLQGENFFEKEGIGRWGLDGGWHCIYDAATGKASTDAYTDSLNKDYNFELN